MYACKTWSITKSDELIIVIFKRKFKKNIYGSKLNPETGSYEKKNEEIESKFNRPNIQTLSESFKARVGIDSGLYIYRGRRIN